MLPSEESYSTLQFRFFPEFAKDSHFIRLTRSNSNQVIYLLGTVHGRHFNVDSNYPYWQLRSVIETLHPERLILEIRPQEFSNGMWGASPPEMSYAALVAKVAGVSIAPMDYWGKNYDAMKDFEIREDHMEDLIYKESDGQKVSLVLTGYSHILGLSKRLLSHGFSVDKTFSSRQKRMLLNETAKTEIPSEYFNLSKQAISLVEKGQTDFNVQWAEGRKKLLDYLQEKR